MSDDIALVRLVACGLVFSESTSDVCLAALHAFLLRIGRRCDNRFGNRPCSRIRSLLFNLLTPGLCSPFQLFQSELEVDSLDLSRVDTVDARFEGN